VRLNSNSSPSAGLWHSANVVHIMCMSHARYMWHTHANSSSLQDSPFPALSKSCLIIKQQHLVRLRMSIDLHHSLGQ
jgi:hypothetical protein